MHWLKIVYYSVLVLALAACIPAYKNRKYFLFIPLIALNIGVEVIREFIEKPSRLETSILLFQVIAEYSLLSLIIANFLRSLWKRKIIVISVYTMIPIFIILQLILIGNNKSYKYLNQMIEAPLICAWTTLYLFETARHEEEFNLTSNPMFWISFGNILFYSGSLFSYGLGSYLESKGNDKAADAIFLIAQILNILLYILYFIGFLCILRSRRLLSSQF
ncbi:MAG: hypothetical protein WCF67_13825 [Chitinophagaceae bacterium]